MHVSYRIPNHSHQAKNYSLRRSLFDATGQSHNIIVVPLSSFTMALQGRKSAARCEASRDAALLKEHYEARTPLARKLFGVQLTPRPPSDSNCADITERNVHQRRIESRNSIRHRLIQKVNYPPGDILGPKIMASLSTLQQDDELENPWSAQRNILTPKERRRK